MTALVLACIAFLLLHRVVSASPLRISFVRRWGERSFQTTFALASAVLLICLGLAYAMTSAPYDRALWDAPRWTRGLQLLLQPVALLLAVAGLLGPNPTAVGRHESAREADIVQGALRITRHPFLWGIALLASGHMLALPSPRSLLLFGTLLFVALTGTVSIDDKCARRLGDAWRDYSDATSNLPFAAIAAGRQPLRLSEFGARTILVAAGLVLAAAFAHPTFRQLWSPT